MPVASNIEINGGIAKVGGIEFFGVKMIKRNNKYFRDGISGTIRLTAEDFRQVKPGQEQFYVVRPQETRLSLWTCLPGEFVNIMIDGHSIEVKIVGDMLEMEGRKFNQLLNLL
jgi:hypothetical protein